MRKLIAVMLGATLGIWCPAAGPALPAGSGTAVLPNGMCLQGSVQLSRNGKLLFATADRTLALQQFDRVLCAPAARRPAPQRAGHRVTLADGQWVTGALRQLDATTVAIVPSWADQPLTIPRAAVKALGHPPGVITLLDEDFASGLAGWKLRGDPARRKLEADRPVCLILDRAGQTAEHVLDIPVEAGQAALSYRALIPRPAGARWWVDVVLTENGITVPVTVELGGGEGTLLGAAPGLASPTGAPLPTTGWHRLEVELAHGRVLVQVDDQVLHRAPAPAGVRLRKLRVRCTGGPLAGVLAGEVWIRDVRLTRLVDDLPRPAGDGGQDEVWLAAGDQLFGSVLRADQRGIDIRGRFGARTFAWAEVRGVHLRGQAEAPRVSAGEHVRVWVDTGDGSTLDELEGLVTGLTEEHLTLTHNDLGTVHVARTAVRQLQWRFQGRRIELDRGVHHLGERLIDQSATRPEGMALRRTFTLPTVPASARLRVAVACLPAPGDDATVARMLVRGGLRTEVVLNGRAVDYVNRHLARTPAGPATVSIPLPPANLRAGENVLELRQTADAETGRSANCIVSAMVVEIPE